MPVIFWPNCQGSLWFWISLGKIKIIVVVTALEKKKFLQINFLEPKTSKLLFTRYFRMRVVCTRLCDSVMPMTSLSIFLQPLPQLLVSLATSNFQLWFNSNNSFMTRCYRSVCLSWWDLKLKAGLSQFCGVSKLVRAPPECRLLVALSGNPVTVDVFWQTWVSVSLLLSFEFCVTNGNGFCCSPGMVLDASKNVVCSQTAVLSCESRTLILYLESKSSHVWCSVGFFFLFSLLSLTGYWTYLQRKGCRI